MYPEARKSMTTQPSIKWTASQQQAIETVGRDVLVTASAGTGKTAVLSQRVVGRIADLDDPTRRGPIHCWC